MNCCFGNLLSVQNNNKKKKKKENFALRKILSMVRTFEEVARTGYAFSTLEMLKL